MNPNKINLSREDKRNDWGIPATLLIGFSGYMLSIAMTVVIAIIGSELMGPSYKNDIFFNFGVLVISDVTLLSIIYGFLISRGLSLRDLGARTVDRVLEWFRVIPAGVVYLCVTVTLAGMVGYFFPEVDLNQEQELPFTGATSLLEMLFAAVALIVIAPITEELIFRGFIFKGFRGRLGFIGAALISSIIFGIAHGQINVAIDTFALGLLLSYLYEKSGSIWPSVLLHSLKNGLAFYLLFFTNLG